MSIYKEDINEAKERLKAWWDHEIIDRPCIAYNCFKGSKQAPGFNAFIEYIDPWYLAQNWDDIKTCLDNFENSFKNIILGGEAIPRFNPNYGPGIMASVFGIVPKFQSNTVWFQRKTNVNEIISLLENVELNKNNIWYDRLLRVTEYSAKRANGEYSIALSDKNNIINEFSSTTARGPCLKSRVLKQSAQLSVISKIFNLTSRARPKLGRFDKIKNLFISSFCPRTLPIFSYSFIIFRPKSGNFFNSL